MHLQYEAAGGTAKLFLGAAPAQQGHGVGRDCSKDARTPQLVAQGSPTARRIVQVLTVTTLHTAMT